ncbi:NUDIX hydrolase [Candidatus Kaiserbacteria bacterium]|nr:NUDIX hydrolase [Candidatus Kaiserbacteria bacterium]
MNYLDSTALTPVDLAGYDLGEIVDWTSPVLIKVYEGDKPFTSEQLQNWDESTHELVGYVLVKDTRPQKPGRKALWKMPAGHRKKESEETGWDFDRTPRDTAVHETRSETGMRQIPPEAFAYIDKYLHWRKDHWKCVFMARITRADLGKMHGNDPENEGVEPQFFTINEFYDQVYSREVLPEHYQKLVEFGVILSLDAYDAQQEEAN